VENLFQRLPCFANTSSLCQTENDRQEGKKYQKNEGLVYLQAMYFEAKGKYKEAEELTSKMLEEHPDSHFAFKRQVRTHYNETPEHKTWRPISCSADLCADLSSVLPTFALQLAVQTC